MPTAAFFDLDGTLIRGSANIPLALAAFRRGFVPPRDLARDLRNGVSFLVRGASDDRAAEVRDRILRAVAGHRVDEVVALGDDFIPGVAARVTPQARQLLDHHAAAGHDRVVVSATSQEIVERLAARLGMERGAGTVSQVVDGRYTGRLAGPFCYGAGKADVVAALAAEHGYDLDGCYAYSDSVSDLPMLDLVGRPVAVNPEAELRAIAADRGWPVVETPARGWRRLLARAGGGAPATAPAGAAAGPAPTTVLAP